jgi:hypothetical protein
MSVCSILQPNPNPQPPTANNHYYYYLYVPYHILHVYQLKLNHLTHNSTSGYYPYLREYSYRYWYSSTGTTTTVVQVTFTSCLFFSFFLYSWRSWMYHCTTVSSIILITLIPENDTITLVV